MKKFFKFLFGTFSVIAAACGVIFLYKNVMKKDDDFDDLDDDFDDDFDDFETEKEGNASESREYVPINLSNSQEETSEEDSEETTPESNDSEETVESASDSESDSTEE